MAHHVMENQRKTAFGQPAQGEVKTQMSCCPRKQHGAQGSLRGVPSCQETAGPDESTVCRGVMEAVKSILDRTVLEMLA
ncbi:hypothetical protein CapIbe_011834 [Capra ibex]